MKKPFGNHEDDIGPQTTLGRIRNDLDAIFEHFFGRWMEPVDISQGMSRFGGLQLDDKEEEFVFRVELPGFAAKDLDVQTANNTLTIRAARKPKSAKKAQRENPVESSFRSYHRSVMLPHGIQRDAIHANYSNGVLQIHVPKTDEGKPKRILVSN